MLANKTVIPEFPFIQEGFIFPPSVGLNISALVQEPRSSAAV